MGDLTTPALCAYSTYSAKWAVTNTFPQGYSGLRCTMQMCGAVRRFVPRHKNFSGTPSARKEKKGTCSRTIEGGGGWTTHADYSCRRVQRMSENNSTFSTVFTHVSVPVDKHGNPFIYKRSVRPVLDNVSFMVSRGGPFFPPPHRRPPHRHPPQSRPTTDSSSVSGWAAFTRYLKKHPERRGGTRRYSECEDRRGKPRCHYRSALTPSLRLAA